jgi:hypothetical protein
LGHYVVLWAGSHISEQNISFNFKAEVSHLIPEIGGCMFLASIHNTIYHNKEGHKNISVKTSKLQK